MVRYIDEFGNLRPGITAGKLQKIIPKIISDFRDVGYDNIDYPWLNSRKGLDNFNNLRSCINNKQRNMKNIFILISLLYNVSLAIAQTNYYTTTKTFNEQGTSINAM